MSKRLPYSSAQWAWIDRKRKEGYTLTMLADFLGVSCETVRQNLRKINDPVPSKDELGPLDKNEFNSLGGVE